MTISLKKNKKATTITLPSDLGAILATPLKEKLSAAIDLKQPIVIDASQVTHCHSLCLQLLLATQLTASKEQLTLTYKNPSEHLQEASQILGLKLEFTGAA